jgi:hypothetical protein
LFHHGASDSIEDFPDGLIIVVADALGQGRDFTEYVGRQIARADLFKATRQHCTPIQ